MFGTLNIGECRVISISALAHYVYKSGQKKARDIPGLLEVNPRLLKTAQTKQC